MATVGLGLCPEGGLSLQIILDIALPGMPAREAEALIKKAYQVCPYSKAMR
jgi:organic hydroperoxide reductase OsmC/OhrA